MASSGFKWLRRTAPVTHNKKIPFLDVEKTLPNTSNCMKRIKLKNFSRHTPPDILNKSFSIQTRFVHQMEEVHLLANMSKLSKILVEVWVVVDHMNKITLAHRLVAFLVRGNQNCCPNTRIDAACFTHTVILLPFKKISSNEKNTEKFYCCDR